MEKTIKAILSLFLFIIANMALAQSVTTQNLNTTGSAEHEKVKVESTNADASAILPATTPVVTDAGISGNAAKATEDMASNQPQNQAVQNSSPSYNLKANPQDEPRVRRKMNAPKITAPGNVDNHPKK